MAQRNALQPLASDWNKLGEQHKRKWLVISQNFPAKTETEQRLLHSRMTEWARLSPAQRVTARLNFAETQELSPAEKKIKWQAYQALSAEEKKKLAATSSKPAGAANAVKPIPAQKLATVPKSTSNPKHPAKIAAAPHEVNHNTLLPNPLQMPVVDQSH